MADVSGFSNLISFLTGADAFSLLFPFLIAWMLYYAMIEETEIFQGTTLNNAPPIMALFLAFFTARFLVMQPFYQSFFSVFFGKIVIGLTALLGLYTLLAFSGWDINSKDNDVDNYIKAIGVMMAGAAFVWAGGFGPALFGPEAATGPINGVINAIGSSIDYLFESGAIWLVVIGGAMAAVMVPGNNDSGGKDETSEEPE